MKRISVLLLTFVLTASPVFGADDYVERMEREHAGDTPVAAPAALEKPSGPVTVSEVEYASLEGTKVGGFLAVPTVGGEGAPAVIVIHEWWGLNDNIRAMARRLAGEGYQALAVDLYEGAVTDDRKKASDLMRDALEDSRRLEENLRQAYHWLVKERKAPQVGVVGWCFGGAWSLQTALLLPKEIDATVIYYGRVVNSPEALKSLEMPVLGFFGALDRGIPVDQVRRFEEILTSLDKDARIHVYEGADHAFANPSGTKYRKEAAEDAWGKTVEFFSRHLKK